MNHLFKTKFSLSKRWLGFFHGFEVVNYHTKVSYRGGGRPVHKGMLRRLRCLISADWGAAAVEMALVLPFLMVTLMGIIEFGRVLYSHQVITNAAREASRASATDFEPYAEAANRLLGPAGIPSPTASCETSPSIGYTSICQTIVTIPLGTTTAQAHQVTISYNIAYMTPLGSLLEMFAGESSLGEGITITSTAVMRE